VLVAQIGILGEEPENDPLQFQGTPDEYSVIGNGSLETTAFSVSTKSFPVNGVLPVRIS